ncbi:MAG TPA: dTDP-glucose 4,6-dehydratase [Thermoanaerobaculia bacterium]|nr:dTDP-glucose 4,6-dehydratase [Thermoanaerobaculia bacterium]
MDTLLVTGGAGFIGSNLVRRALEATADRVVVLDNLTYAGSAASLEELPDAARVVFVRGDIADRDLVDAVFRDHRPRALLNLAAETHVDRSIDDPRPFVRTNIQGTFELLEAARRHLAGAGASRAAAFRFLHVSTDEVFGSLGEEGLFREDTAYAPRSPYSASKAAADHLVRAFHHTYGLPAIVTNCSNNYGPYQFPEKLIPLMILNAIEAKPLPIYGDGAQVRDWLYVEDHCDGLLEVLERGRPGESYNLGGRCERSNLETVTGLCAVLEELCPAGSNPALRERGIGSYAALVTHVADRPGHDRRYAIDASKIGRELGWTPRTSFDDGLRATVRWYLDHAHWCEAAQGRGYRRERLGLIGS